MRKAKFFYLTMTRTVGNKLAITPELTLWLVIESVIKLVREKGEQYD